MMMMTCELSDMSKMIASSLNEAHRQLEKNSAQTREWTKTILSQLADLATNLGFSSCPDNNGDRAWLYDMVWYTVDEQTRRTLSVPMVLEMEWIPRIFDVRYDFEKLLLARSQLKVLIADGHCHGLEDMVTEGLKTFDPVDNIGTYLLAKYTPNGFECKTFKNVNGNICQEQTAEG